MSRKHCKRKHYPLSLDPVAFVIAGAAIPSEALLDKLRVLELAALQAWADGVATTEDWKTFADLVNLTTSMCGMGVGPEAMVAAHRAEAALLRAHGRYATGLPMTASRTDVQAFRDLYQFHDLQRSSVARSVYERAITLTIGKIKGAGPSVRVCAARQTVAV